MIFEIIPGNPSYHIVECEDMLSLSEYIESIFSMYAEDAIMRWNGICVPIGYKYDLSYMIDDILIILDDLFSKSYGKRMVAWLPDTFRSNWNIFWNKEDVAVDASWWTVVGNEGVEIKLNQNRRVLMGRKQFVAEWQKLLAVVVSIIKDDGSCKVKREELDRLFCVFERATTYVFDS